MKLTINGEIQSIKANPSLTSLDMIVELLGYNPRSIVVEFNGIIINRDQWADQIVQDGDRLEIVTIVGGGS